MTASDDELAARRARLEEAARPAPFAVPQRAVYHSPTWGCFCELWRWVGIVAVYERAYPDQDAVIRLVGMLAMWSSARRTLGRRSPYPRR